MADRKELVATGEIVLLEPKKEYEEDTYRLCGSKHLRRIQDKRGNAQRYAIVAQ